MTESGITFDFVGQASRLLSWDRQNAYQAQAAQEGHGSLGSRQGPGQAVK